MSSYQHVAIATDFSTYSTWAAARGKALAAASNAALSVLHVIDYLPPTYVAVQLPPQFASSKALIENARVRLDDWIKECELEVANGWIEVGSPREKILSLPQTRGVDLVVLGASGTGKLHALMGSTALGVAHNLKCDVLIVAPQSSPDGH